MQQIASIFIYIFIFFCFDFTIINIINGIIIIYIDKIFVIGGSSIYNLCLENTKYFNQIDKIHLSVIYQKYNCDTFINLKQILKLHKHYDINDVKFYKEFINLTYYLRN